MLDYEQLKKEAKQDLFVDESTIISASAKNGVITCKWLDYYREMALQYNNDKVSKDKIELALYLYYTGKANQKQLEALNKTKPFSLKIDTKADIEKFIKASSEYIDVCSKLAEDEQTLKFIDETIQALKFQNNKISNIISYKKFTEGFN